MDWYYFRQCTYVRNVHTRVESQEQLDYICISFSSCPIQSSPILFTFGIDIEVANLGLYLGKISAFGSSMKCVIVRHLREWKIKDQSMNRKELVWSVEQARAKNAKPQREIKMISCPTICSQQSFAAWWSRFTTTKLNQTNHPTEGSNTKRESDEGPKFHLRRKWLTIPIYKKSLFFLCRP